MIFVCLLGFFSPLLLLSFCFLLSYCHPEHREGSDYIHFMHADPSLRSGWHEWQTTNNEGYFWSDFCIIKSKNEGRKETPATTCFVITGAKVGGGKYTRNFLWCGWYKLVGEWSKLFSKWCSAVTSIPLSLLVLATGKAFFLCLQR